MSLRETFAQLKSKNHRAFIAYITAGDPNLEATEEFVWALDRAGADIIELGVPFSDPVADGITNQRAAERALKAGTTLKKIFLMVEKLRADGFKKALVLFTYYNPILRLGLEHFATSAKKAGFNGVLVLDLPPEEAKDYAAILSHAHLEAVFLASPTTHPERLRKIDEHSTGFLYYVSRTGVTGVQNDLSESLGAEVAALRQIVRAPIAVGFGISDAEQSRAVAKISDGVIVGSALVKIIEEACSGTKTFALKETSQKLEKLVRDLASPTKENF